MAVVAFKDTQEQIPVGKILCIGQNYAAHAKEMQSDVSASPIFFMKPATAIIHQDEQIVLPSLSNNVHHEVELTVLIGTGGKNIPREHALKHVAGYGIGLDMTMRDVQAEAKKLGQPWTLAKGFDTSAPISEFLPAAAIGNPSTLSVQLHVNGTLRQSSKTSNLIFPVDVLIAYISQFITLERGDILYTGTPEGVARVTHGDQLTAALLNAAENTLVALHVSVQ
ncbi:MAG TPA: fumarylacetoacetate hydrolase family protein [Bacteroidota bacterium]|nr:fumarylacetoacetate hydrolase family protein [Bacteroidota bacterium]